MSRQFDAIICDIDGCLGPESADPLDAQALCRLADHNRRAIQSADRPVITVCSGRPQPFAEAICRLIHNSALPCVAENGVWIFDPRDNRFLRDPSITLDHLRAVAEASRWIESDFGPRGVVIQPGKTASISLWHPDTGYLRSLQPTLASRYRAEAWPFRVSMTVAWINCDLDHISKASGLARFVQLTGLDRSRLAGIGDTLTDLAIADNVAFFACPANADERLKSRAAYVASGREAHGVLEIVERVSSA